MRVILLHSSIFMVFICFLCKATFAQWQTLNTSTLDQINCIQPVGDKLLAGTYQGLFSTTNQGATWTNLDPSGNVLSVFAETQDEYYMGLWGKLNSVRKTSNAGLSWQDCTSPHVSNVTDINSLRKLGLQLIAGEYGKYFSSTDGGNSWTENSIGTSTHGVVDMIESGNIYLATASKTVYASTNIGTSWSVSNTGIGNPHNIHNFAESGNTLLVSADSAGLYRSTDSGLSWISVSIPTASRVRKVKVVNGIWLIGTHNEGVFKSNDDGASWDAFSTGLDLSLPYNLLEADSAFVYAGNLGNIYSIPVHELGVHVNTEHLNNNFDTQETALFYPNPVRNKLYLNRDLVNNPESIHFITFHASDGKRIRTYEANEIFNTNGISILTTEGEYPVEGFYFISIHSKNGEIRTQKIILNGN